MTGLAECFRTLRKRGTSKRTDNSTPEFADFYTCFTHLKYTCLYLDGSWLHYARICIPIFFLTTGAFSFAMGIVVHLHDRNTIWLIENGHWCIVYIAVIFWDFQIGFSSKTVFEMSKAIKYGVYRYRNYEKADKLVFEKMNARVVSVSRGFGVVYFAAVIGTLVKSTFLEDSDPYKHFFNGWFPFEINSFTRVNLVRIYELGGAWSASSGGCTFFVTFMAYTYHIEAHMDVLVRKIRSLFDPVGKDNDEYRKEVDMRIRECLGHHRAVLKLFNDFSNFCNPLLGCATLTATFLICTLLYLMTSSDFDVSVIITFSGVIAPEFCLLVSFRLRGQKLTDMSLEVNSALYELEWLEQDMQIRKDLLMWLRLTSKAWELKAFGYRNLSHTGIKEVLQTSYTFFNMLKAAT